MYSVMSCENEEPSDNDDAERPARLRTRRPVAIATGSEPTSAAIVVIMIGRNRTCARLHDGFCGRQFLLVLGLEREVHHHDRVLLHDPDEENDADEREHTELHVTDEEREQPAERGERKARRES